MLSQEVAIPQDSYAWENRQLGISSVKMKFRHEVVFVALAVGSGV